MQAAEWACSTTLLIALGHACVMLVLPCPPLQDAYGGFLDPQVADDFVYYADIVFSQLGQHVKHWLTFSDPMAICQMGYGVGIYAPGEEQGAAGQYK